ILCQRDSRKEQKEKRGDPARHAAGVFPKAARIANAKLLRRGAVCYKAPAEAVWLGGRRCSGEWGDCSTRAVSRISSTGRTTRLAICMPCSPTSRSAPAVSATRPCAGRHVVGE